VGAAAAATAGPEGDRIFIGRQPILDAGERVVAYELLYRDSAESESAIFSDHRVAATRIMANTFSALGADAILGRYPGFINVDRETLVGDLALALPRERITLELLEQIPPDRAVRAACSRLRAAGFSLALDDYVPGDARDPLFDLVDTVKVDLAAVDDAGLADVARHLSGRGLSLVAEKVESRASFLRCRELGFQRFQGFYFAKPTVISGRKLDPAREVLLELIARLHQDAELTAIAADIGRQPRLASAVMQLIRSGEPGDHPARRASDLGRAIEKLGRERLARWLHVLLFAGGDGAAPGDPILLSAARRARLMQLLGRSLDASRGAEERAFLVGLVSFVDALLGIPLAEALETLRIDLDLRRALLAREGQLGRLLALVESLDARSAGATAELADEAGLDASALVRAELEAFHFAQALEAR
jgi:EAL and modified HD-GYP domain-containing signal transduction protein